MTVTPKSPAEQVYCQDRADWRAWLLKHHKQEQGIWLVYDKGAKRKLSNDDIVEEVLCFTDC